MMKTSFMLVIHPTTQSALEDSTIHSFILMSPSSKNPLTVPLSPLVTITLGSAIRLVSSVTVWQRMRTRERGVLFASNTTGTFQNSRDAPCEREINDELLPSVPQDTVKESRLETRTLLLVLVLLLLHRLVDDRWKSFRESCEIDQIRSSRAQSCRGAHEGIPAG